MLGRGRAGGAGLLLVCLVAWGCGDEDARSPAQPAAEPRSGRGGVLGYGLSQEPGALDPLFARNPTAQLVTRQIHEPLVASLRGPYGDVRRRQGLAVSVAASQDRQVWRLRLRRGVRFQDGREFDASAVLVNADRWRRSEAARSLLPGLVAVDAPRPAVVRMVFRRPLADLRRRLGSPILGVVSPAAIGRARGAPVGAGRSGTGPYELRERRRGRQIVLARNERWWGTPFDLGPALDQIDFRIVGLSSMRVVLLRRGEIQVADGLSLVQARRLRGDPLLTVIERGAAGHTGLERSVRGLVGERGVQVLSSVWLTRVGAG